MTPAERGAIFRAFVDRSGSDSGESKMIALLDRCQRAEAELDRIRAAARGVLEIHDDLISTATYQAEKWGALRYLVNGQSVPASGEGPGQDAR